MLASRGRGHRAWATPRRRVLPGGGRRGHAVRAAALPGAIQAARAGERALGEMHPCVARRPRAAAAAPVDDCRRRLRLPYPLPLRRPPGLRGGAPRRLPRDRPLQPLRDHGLLSLPLLRLKARALVALEGLHHVSGRSTSGAPEGDALDHSIQNACNGGVRLCQMAPCGNVIDYPRGAAGRQGEVSPGMDGNTRRPLHGARFLRFRWPVSSGNGGGQRPWTAPARSERCYGS
mmetsp:Transcript_20326/g.48420  ORF Transcript_20326/g.48420 Transcript_20326/m.48420 type:complete len:232 (+) Transcript_20326:758-1453(+)